VTHWRVAAGELVLSGGGNAEALRFREASPAGSWQVTALLHGDAVSSVIAGTKLTAVFDASGSLTGSAGCNDFTTTYKDSGGTFSIKPPVATKKHCSEPKG